MKLSPLDFPKIIEEFKKLISNLFFEGQEPTWLSPLINYILLGVLILLAAWGFLFLLSKIKKLWIEEFWPLFYKQEQKRRRLKRQRFAGYLEDEIKKLNRREEWKDYRFTELEAEIEAEGRRKKYSLIPFIETTQKGLRREKSLSKALRFSTERLILVEGEPGSGKSVALRHVTQKLAKQASKSNTLKSVIPIYINLKKLERDSQAIDRNLIDSFVKQELNRINDRDIEEFLDNEFYQGLKEGTWLFLFDSFDELPEVLSSVEADEVTRSYAEAIDDFLHSLNNQCRGIIASRQFRGPKHLGWPRFRILPLENRRKELIKKADLDPSIEKELIKQWRNASHEIQEMTKNPMFLGILCENMRDGSPFPENGHTVFESYLNKRLTRDQERLKKRFNLEPKEVRAIAEQVAFCMTLDKHLGLSPTRKVIRQGMTNVGFRVPGHFDKLLNALEYLKLARSEEETIAGESQQFTFSHRRFQEYFATCIVLRDLEHISPKQLLKDGRWRETTVVIFQTQPSETFTPILTEANKMLTEMVGNMSGLIDDPRVYVSDESQQEKKSLPQAFFWPEGVIHLLGILQDGFRSRLEDLGDNIQYQAECSLLSATVTGTLQDRKWSLEVAGVTSEPILLWLLRDGFASDSQWLKEVAYRQTARLNKIPNDIASAIRKTLLYLFSTGRLYKEYFTTEAHLSRLENSKQYINSLRLLRWIKTINSCLTTLVMIVLIYIALQFPKSLLLPLTISYFICQLFSYFISYPKNNSDLNIILNKLIKSFNLIFFILINSLFLFSARISELILLILLIFSPILWSYCAISSVKIGQFTEIWWWPLLLIFPVVYLFLNYRKLLKIGKYILYNYRIYIIICTLPTIFSMVRILFSDHNNILIKILLDIVFTCLNIFSVIILGFILIFWYKLTKTWLKDWNRWRKWVKQNRYPNTIEIQYLLNLISLYHTRHFTKQLIIISRQRELLVANKDTETLLNELAMVLENSLVLKKQKGEKENLSTMITRIEIMIENYSGSALFTNWLKEYSREQKYRLATLESEFLDELYMLIEQIQARQKTPEKSNN